jgi:2-polyprenyl-6-methoxyphenol hydroxylase-like FAD-dependent oxidoreductase
MAATLLKRCGVDVRVVDKRAGPSTESRAFAVSARSLELFASLGLSERLIEQGTITSEIDLFISGRRAGGLDFDRAEAPDTPFRFILLLPQSRTEAVLIEALGASGLEVERDTEVTGLTQDGDGVQVRGRLADGSERRSRARYVLGADGAHSVVRRALGLSFEGAKYPQNFLLGDVEVDWPLDHGRFRVFMHGERIGLFFPLRGSRLARVMTTDLRAGEGDADAGDLALDELRAAFAEAAGQPVTLRNPTWLTRFRTHHRIVDRYRQGRVFVAGDAGHIHSPAGGQGMNTGLQDAANLAWKLAAVLRGGDEGLLDSYGGERLPVARDVLRFTDRIFGIAAGQSGWRAGLRDLLAPAIVGTASGFDAVQEAAFRRFAQIEISYPVSHAVAGGAGSRAPNAQLSRHRDVFDLLEGYRFNVLAVSRKGLEPAETADVLGRLFALRQRGAGGHLLARQVGGPLDGVDIVERGEVFDRYGLAAEDAQALILVRPDGYIGWRSDTLDFAGCASFLAALQG